MLSLLGVLVLFLFARNGIGFIYHEFEFSLQNFQEQCFQYGCNEPFVSMEIQSNYFEESFTNIKFFGRSLDSAWKIQDEIIINSFFDANVEILLKDDSSTYNPEYCKICIQNYFHNSTCGKIAVRHKFKAEMWTSDLIQDISTSPKIWE